MPLQEGSLRGAWWLSQLSVQLLINLSSGHDLTACEFEPHIRLCADSVESTWDSQSPSLSLSQNKQTFKKKKKKETTFGLNDCPFQNYKSRLRLAV